MESRVLSLSFLSRLVTVETLLNQTSVINCQMGRHLRKCLSSHCYTAVSGDLLHHIVQYHPDRLEDELLCALLAPHVSVVKLDRCSQLTAPGVIQALNTCKQISQLDVRGCDRLMDSPFLSSLVEKASSSLTHLSLERWNSLQDSDIKVLITELSGLTHLNLSQCSSITDKVFLIDEETQATRAQNRPGSNHYGCSLRCVDLSGCRQLTDTVVRHLTTLCGPTLQDINLTFTQVDHLALVYLSGYDFISASTLRQSSKISEENFLELLSNLLMKPEQVTEQNTIQTKVNSSENEAFVESPCVVSKEVEENFGVVKLVADDGVINDLHSPCEHNGHESSLGLSNENQSGASLPGANQSGASLPGATQSGESLPGANRSGASLSGANQSGVSLSVANQPGASLPDATQSNASLPGANQSGASLSGANQSGASLSGANQSGASLSGATQSGASLSGATQSGASLLGATQSGANLSGATQSGASLPGANQSGASLSGANQSGARLPGANQSGASLPGANQSGASLPGANQSGASLPSANQSGASLPGASQSGASLPGANQSGASLSGANQSGESWPGANQSSASLSGASLSGANQSGASLPGANQSGESLPGANQSGASLSGANQSGVSPSGADKLCSCSIPLLSSDKVLSKTHFVAEEYTECSEKYQSEHKLSENLSYDATSIVCQEDHNSDGDSVGGAIIDQLESPTQQCHPITDSVTKKQMGEISEDIILKRIFKPDIQSYEMADHVSAMSSGGSDFSFELFLRNQTGLRQFSVKLQANQDEAELLVAIATHNRNLQKLDINGCFGMSYEALRQVGLKCKNLTSLNLYGVTFVGDAAMLPVVCEGRLTSLNLSETYITDITLMAIASHCAAELKELHLSCCEEISEVGVDHIARSCHALRHLSLRKCPVTHESLHCLTSHCTHMTFLDLSSVNTLEDDILIVMATRMRNLAQLDISWNIEVTDVGVMAVMMCCSGLNKLVLSGLKQLSTLPFLPIMSNHRERVTLQSVLKLSQKYREFPAEERDSSDEEMDEITLPVRSTCYVPVLREIYLEYVDHVNDDILAQIVAVCHGSLTIKDYYSNDIQPSLLSSKV